MFLNKQMTALKPRQTGLSLIELMISIAIGLVVVGGVISMFVSTVTSNADNLKMTRLNQELRAVMDIMTRDIKRAGYRGNVTIAPAVAVGTLNPFASGVNDVSTGTVNIPNDCIAFTYDANNNAAPIAVVEDVDRFGFRRDLVGTVGVISTRTPSAGATGCATGTWEYITDESAIDITVLSLTILPNPLVRVPITGVPGLFRVVRNVSITLTGQLRNSNPVITRTLTERVRIQNDLITN